MVGTTGVMKHKVKILRDIYGELFVRRHRMKLRHGTNKKKKIFPLVEEQFSL